MINSKRKAKKHILQFETEEIKQLNEWIEWQKSNSEINPLSIQSSLDNAPAGKSLDGTFSPYAGVKIFRRFSISRKTKEMLEKRKFITMSEIQRASLPHSLCGRDILGAAKTGCDVVWCGYSSSRLGSPDYIHRVGRTAHFTSEGKSVLFLDHLEREMLNELRALTLKYLYN